MISALIPALAMFGVFLLFQHASRRIMLFEAAFCAAFGVLCLLLLPQQEFYNADCYLMYEFLVPCYAAAALVATARFCLRFTFWLCLLCLGLYLPLCDLLTWVLDPNSFYLGTWLLHYVATPALITVVLAVADAGDDLTISFYEFPYYVPAAVSAAAVGQLAVMAGFCLTAFGLGSEDAASRAIYESPHFYMHMIVWKGLGAGLCALYFTRAKLRMPWSRSLGAAAASAFMVLL